MVLYKSFINRNNNIIINDLHIMLDPNYMSIFRIALSQIKKNMRKNITVPVPSSWFEWNLSEYAKAPSAAEWMPPVC